VVSKANQYARDHGLRQFVVYQGKWSAAYRDFEREIIMMCESEGMGIAPWGSLGSGNFKTVSTNRSIRNNRLLTLPKDDQRKSTEGRLSSLHGGPSDAEIAVSKVLEKLATEKGTVMTSIAYVVYPEMTSGLANL
jgi:aryl-alcohol dehydrogenase-like predicted oxidoreductase